MVIFLHFLSFFELFHSTLHYTTLHCTTLHYTALHYTTLHYTTLLMIERGHEVSVKQMDAKDLKLKQYGEFLYDNIAIFASKVHYTTYTTLRYTIIHYNILHYITPY